MKRGISLIAVLMFMLAATTASVVVFRLIGSENFSSGARLKATEAYQASESGIDAVQAWLSNRAMDASGLVTQYETYKQPIELKVGGENINQKQNFKAYLVGVDFRANSVVKLKFIVEGEGRDGSKVSQAVIFSTDGLYKVVVEHETPPPSSSSANIRINDYHGGSTAFSGSKEISSMTINGNWGGGRNGTGSNPGKIKGDFIVTGDAKLSGNNADVEGTICVGGDLSFDNSNTDNKNAYIGSGGQGTNGGFCGGYDDVYSEGNVRSGQSCNVRINGSLTLNGTLLFQGANSKYVKKDLVLLSDGVVSGENAQSDESKRFHVCGSVWSENPNGIINATTSNASQYHLFNSNSNFNIVNSTSNLDCSGTTTKNLYFNNLQSKTIPMPTNPYEYKTENNNYIRSTLNLNPPPPNDKYNATRENKPAGADSVKEYCTKFLIARDGCDNAKYTVADPIVTSLLYIKKFLADSASKSIQKYGNFECMQDKTLDVGSNAMINTGSGSVGFSEALNNCYTNLNSNQHTLLYGGRDGYLIVKLNHSQESKNPNMLNGKFILIYESHQGKLGIAPTSGTSNVMMFLEKGTDELVGSDNCSGLTYNYFIFAEENITRANNFSEVCPLKGNIFFPASSCAGLRDVNNNFKLESNTSLVNDLVDKGVLCPAGQQCPPGSSSSSSPTGTSSPSTAGDDETDKNFSTIASRLSVSIDSKEITKEKIPASTELNPSMLVMPRIVRLKAGQINSIDKLSEYYNIIGLNGAAVPEPKPKPQGNCGIPTGSDAFKTKGTYTCTFTDQKISNFFVLIE